MNQYAVLLSIPGLRSGDLALMPRLSGLADSGEALPLTASFPCMTSPVQIAMTTGKLPREHGVVANGFFWRDSGKVEMWTAWNESVESPQIWELLQQHDPELTSAVWFPRFAKGGKADFICTEAPIHNPDGSESLWCYTKPTELYGDLRDELGHFPLMNFWGPLSSIKSTDWIVDSAVIAAKRYRPRFSYIYLPHLDYAAQIFGPESPEATAALTQLDSAIGRLVDGYSQAGLTNTLWLAASEYVITPVSGASFPNRRLREAGCLQLREEQGLEHLDPAGSKAWALVDHQLAHVFVQNADDIEAVASLFRDDESVDEVLVGDDREKYALDHPHSGEIVLVSKLDKWFAYYWWLDDDKAPPFARTIDIHQKPGYDPVEMFIDMPAKTTPLDASLVKGSHGYPADTPDRRGILLCSSAIDGPGAADAVVRDVDVAAIVLRNFGVDV